MVTNWLSIILKFDTNASTLENLRNEIRWKSYHKTNKST